MSADLMKTFNEYIMPVISQQIPQRIAAFNEAAPAIQLSAEGIVGDFFEQSFYNALHDSYRDVDIYASNDDVTPVDLSQGQWNQVKVHDAMGPIRFEPKQFALLQKPTQEGVQIIASQFVDAYLRAQLNKAVGSVVAAIENNAALVYDESTAGGAATPAALRQVGLNRSHAKMGDGSAMLTTQIMRGGMDGQHAFIEEALENGNQLFMSETVMVVDILGKRTVVSDIPALTADAGATSKVVTLTDGAIIVTETSMPYTNIETTNGKGRIESTWQTEIDYVLGLKGYSWDETNGGKSPLSADLETGANWDKVQEDKYTAGVLYIADSVA
ncbi:major capsid protein [Vibrio phage 1.085.O._10N.222.51.E3]|nr:major capsid protein [Vibrio phage 1.085.O._10N.222.51.E3]AUR88134.1 major capsid protein [Vibrio phage 1.110.O._10N.261.52.C1]AUR88623.1 major capsid protein [Vibrio phage 1.116.O._10N.222.52.C10]AUR89873.1 major capsid protein [Vibrio phage 1.134.O._10N.222.52.B8]AUR92421.1 major capsid protein [Vibrio phage 1.172.O._10N.261.52.F5]AUR92708.1 major capsid protein [Vibrio phage 1.176.O._10N.261.55.F5]AUR97443.1 major capsid protein [Vibrio phage 1.239.O._10N.261.52.F6]